MAEAAYWEHFHHVADIGVRGFGPTLESAFCQAALALTGVIADPECVRPDKRVGLCCEAPDREMLLVDWLNALVYEMAVGNLLFGRFEVNIAGNRLTGAAWGEPVDVARHQPAVEVKGATYTALEVRQEAKNLWVAQCVVDV